MGNGKFFPDFGGYSTGNPLLDIMSGFKKKEEELDPFDINMDVDAIAAAAPPAALPEAPAAAAAPAAAPAAAAPVRTLQKKELINKERKKRKEEEERAKGTGKEPEKGRGAGQGLWTGDLQSGGFGTGRRVGKKGWDD